MSGFFSDRRRAVAIIYSGAFVFSTIIAFIDLFILKNYNHWLWWVSGLTAVFIIGSLVYLTFLNVPFMRGLRKDVLEETKSSAPRPWLARLFVLVMILAVCAAVAAAYYTIPSIIEGF